MARNSAIVSISMNILAADLPLQTGATLCTRTDELSYKITLFRDEALLSHHHMFGSLQGMSY
jgi:hypothetical protein